MELEHRFEVPADIDRAWAHLLDMEKVAACFPGATLTSADGDKYTGTVKVKLGPIQLTYAGSARIVSADEKTRTATIEASGTAARSGSTASMTVVAKASSVSANVTAVEMTTDLSVTGKPAQFGRGVMAEVGNKILGRFADCLSSKLADTAADETDDAAAATGGAADGAAATEPSGADASEAAAAAEPTTPRAGSDEHTGASAAGPSSTYTRVPAPEPVEPIDLLESARGSIVKRLAPVIAGLAVICLWRLLRRRRAARRD